MYSSPTPFDRPSPDLAWLCHPVLTGLPAQQRGALIAALMTPYDQQREMSLDKRRGHRPRLIAPGVGRRPVLTLADRLLATILHQRLALPQTAIAALSGVRPETVDKMALIAAGRDHPASVHPRGQHHRDPAGHAGGPQAPARFPPAAAWLAGSAPARRRLRG